VKDADGKVRLTDGVPTLRGELLDDAQILRRGRERLKRTNGVSANELVRTMLKSKSGSGCSNLLESLV